MKKILYLFLVVAVFGMQSCFKIDNWDEPDCTFHGTVIDSYTNEPLLASQNDWQIRIWERTWTGHDGGATSQQDLRIKQDGSYKNSKLFAGTYDMLPYDGPFWPADTLKNVVLKGTTKQDFKVTPYLQVIDFNTRLEKNANGRDVLYLTCRLKAPRTEGLPNLRYVQAFLSLSTFCGNGSNSYISIAEYTNGPDGSRGRIDINRSWANEMNATGMNPNGDTSKEYTIGPLPLNAGYTYHVRIGASVNVGSNRFCYSPIKEIQVPK